MSNSAGNRCMRCMEPIDATDCFACGFNLDDVYDVQYARPGTVIGGRYLLGICARKNGEGALYAGFDNATQQKVWIREYFPQTIAQRDFDTGAISPLSGCGAQYKALMSDFVDICNEIKRLSITEQVVPLEGVVSENNTVYAIYKGLKLVSFEQYLEENGGILSFRHAFSLLLPICNTLEVLHSHGQIHRGISPYTIYMGPRGKLYLWDFALGATRTSGSELNCELFSGYSAPEQYSPNGWQGSWTDVYAMGALFYRTLTGVVPPKSTRIDKEQNQLAHMQELSPELDDHISDTVQQAMFPASEARFQTLQTFLSQLMEENPANTSVYELSSLNRENGGSRKNPAPRHTDDTLPTRRSRRPRRERERGGGTFKYMLLGTMAMLLVLVGVIYYFVTNQLPNILGGPMDIVATPYDDPRGEDPGPQPPEMEAVPTFVGRRFADIENDPNYRDRFNFSTRFESRPDWQGGIIFDQGTPPGTMVLSGGRTSITLWISLEDVPMPNVVGFSLEQATDILANLDIENINVIERISAEEPDTVLQSIPAMGSSVNPDRDTVNLVVAIPAPEVETPAQTQPGTTGLPANWRNLTPAEFAALPPDVRAAIIAALAAEG